MSSPERHADPDSLARRLAAAELRLNAILNALVDALVVIDEHGRIETVNPAAERTFGYRAEELLGRNVSVLMPPPDRDHHDRYIERYLESGGPRIIGIGREVRAVRADGSIFPADIAVGEVRLPEGRRFIGLVRDISRRVQTEQALATREEELRMMFEQAPVAILDCDLDGTVRRANAACRRLLDAGAETLIGRRLTELVDAGSVPAAEEALARLAAGMPVLRAVELRLRGTRRGPTHASAHLARVGAPGRGERLVVHMVDRTEQVRAEEEARAHRERLAHVGRLSTVGEMASGLAHEINQPLTAVSTYARACQRLQAAGRSDSAEFRDALAQIGVQADRAAEIVQRLRGFVRRRESRIVPVDLHRELGAVLELAAVDARAHRARIVLEPGAPLPPVAADAIQIQQVVLNLIRNAIEAMESVAPGEKVVRVCAECMGTEGVEVRIADVGAGLDPETARMLFQPFFTTKAAGLGLGLSISRSIVEAHGGRLWHSANEPRGTVFHFTVPVAAT